MKTKEQAALEASTMAEQARAAQESARTEDALREASANAAQTEPAAIVAEALAGPSRQTYGVLRPVLHGNRVYQRGERLQLDHSDAKHLIQTRAIGVISTEPVLLVDGEPIFGAAPTPSATIPPVEPGTAGDNAFARAVDRALETI